LKRREHSPRLDYRSKSITRVLKISVGVLVRFSLMAAMVVVMIPMLSGMLMIVLVPTRSVRVLVEMFVHVLMGMFVGMVMGVRLAVMRMLVGMRMSVLMPMQMLVLVFSFHGTSSLSQVVRLPRLFMALTRYPLYPDKISPERNEKKSDDHDPEEIKAIVSKCEYFHASLCP
jgi:hypothetical protein